jgi:hypothetical protein
VVVHAGANRVEPRLAMIAEKLASVPAVGVEVGVKVFDFRGPIGQESPLDAAACSPAGPCVAILEKAVVLPHFAIGEAACAVNQEVRIKGRNNADAAANCAEIRDALVETKSAAD